MSAADRVVSAGGGSQKGAGRELGLPRRAGRKNNCGDCIAAHLLVFCEDPLLDRLARGASAVLECNDALLNHSFGSRHFDELGGRCSTGSVLKKVLAAGFLAGSRWVFS